MIALLAGMVIALLSLLAHCYTFLRYGDFNYLDLSVCNSIGLFCSADSAWVGVNKMLVGVGNMDIGFVSFFLGMLLAFLLEDS